MLKNKITTLAVTAALGLSFGLVACSTGEGTVTDTSDATATSTTSSDDSTTETTDTKVDDTEKDEEKDIKKDKKKSFFSAAGYQGKLEDGKSFVYIEIGGDTVMVSLTDDEHEGDGAETYSGKAVEDADGKTTVTDDESGKSITFTITEKDDGGVEVDVEGHGKGELQGYEGNIFSVIGSMAEDDAAAEEADAAE